MKGSMYGFRGAASVYNSACYISKCLVDLTIICTKTNDRFYFFFYQFSDQRIIISFVDTSKDEDSGLVHAFQCIPCTIYICCFAIVNELNTTNGCDRLHSMFKALKSGNSFSY